VNYYEHHIGDYAAATAHLSWDEDMAYTRLLRAYYHHEKGIPQGQEYRIARATTAAQRKAVDAVLREFFSLNDGAYSQKRADEEIARFQEKRGKAKASANARWSHSERNANAYANAPPDKDANAMRTQCEGNALQTPDTRHQTPIPTSQPKAARGERASAPARPPDVSEQVWTDWTALRRSKKAPVTQTVLDGAIAEAGKAKLSLNAFLAEWCQRGSQGLKADWLVGRNGAAAAPSDAERHAETRRLLGFKQETFDA
jgi:uncharacterized protein YdaU (DUF1376 family)